MTRWRMRSTGASNSGGAANRIRSGLRNHGVLAVGNSVAEAFNNTYRIERACRTQLMAQTGADPIVLPGEDVIAKTNYMYKPGTRRPYGVLEWPAMLRMLDRHDGSYRD